MPNNMRGKFYNFANAWNLGYRIQMDRGQDIFLLIGKLST
jgi:hypothetical protein